ncbi:MAG: ribosome-associated translation inhibitor RaiA [Chlamydiae bacterium]|nr:ribosome-associated translation inhibitor RaiA [Chlamydiota bacterium]
MAQRANHFEENSENPLKVTVVGRNLPVTDALKQHIMDKMARIEEITPQVIDAIVYLEVQKTEQRVEILYKFSHFKVVAKATSHDMYEAFHMALGHLRRKLRKWKTKIQNHHAKKLSQVELSVQVLDKSKDELNDINDQIVDENFLHIEKEFELPKVVKKKKRPLKTLTMEEAVMKMDLTDDHFMVYRSEEDQKIKVIYVRRDKTLGVIEVE